MRRNIKTKLQACNLPDCKNILNEEFEKKQGICWICEEILQDYQEKMDDFYRTRL